jgi:Ni/Fe-hydrogenase subunit HybB-like protein
MTAMNEFEKADFYEHLLPQKFGRAGKAWTILLTVICGVGLFAYYRQLRYGLGVTGMRDYVSWGIYISNFVFFVAVSLVGSLITSVLRLTNASWSTPLTRIAEVIAVASILFAALIIIVDMGRPDRLLNLFVYGRLQSPILWDVMVITTYLVLSVLLLYIPLIPDLGFMLKQDHGLPAGIRKLYSFLGSFWSGSPAQERLMERAIKILVITIMPVAFAIHTVTSWLFATTYRPGWDSTNFGAYFVSGAFLVGAAGVIVAMYVLRRAYKLEAYITEEHFNHMGKLLVFLAALYLYFNINEYLVPAYKMKTAEQEHLLKLFTGEFAWLFWVVLFSGMILPIIVLIIPSGRKPLPMFIIGIIVVVASWFKRMLIVTPTLLSPFLPMSDVPDNYRYYFPTWEEWSITGASLAGSLLLMTLMIRYLPIIPITEIIKEKGEKP